MPKNRIDRLNSSLREVISDVIKKDVKNPHVNELLTVTRVSITKDLRYAKAYVSVIGSDEEKQETINALQSAAGFISIQSSKQIVIRYFPELRFILDDSAEQHSRIETILEEIKSEQENRPKEEMDE